MIRSAAIADSLDDEVVNDDSLAHHYICVFPIGTYSPGLQTALYVCYTQERRDLSRTYLAHHELESVVSFIIVIITCLVHSSRPAPPSA